MCDIDFQSIIQDRMEIIKELIESSLVAGVIVAIITAFNNRRINFTQYITKDREEWRKEIRIIAVELENCRSYRSLSVILVKLKLRINPYGKNIHIDMENESTSGITQDAHIWKLIESMEADKELKKFKTNKERMIMYLSLLLKHNWEKEKYDFRGNIYKKILVFTAVLSAIYVTYNHFVVFKNKFNAEYATWLLLVVGLLFGIVAFLKYIKEKFDGHKVIKSILVIVALIIMSRFMVYTVNYLIRYYGGISIVEDIDFVFTYIVYMLVLGCYPVALNENIDVKYEKNVKSIYLGTLHEDTSDEFEGTAPKKRMRIMKGKRR